MLHGAAALWAWIVGGLVSLATAATAGAVVWNKVVRPLVQRLHAMSDLIERELQPNGGGSIKDAVTEVREVTGPALAAGNGVISLHDKTDAQHRQVMGRLDALGAEQAAIAAKVDVNSQRLVTAIEWQRDHENAHRRTTDHGGTP